MPHRTPTRAFINLFTIIFALALASCSLAPVLYLPPTRAAIPVSTPLTVASTPEPSATAAGCGVVKGDIQDFTVATKILRRPIQVKVYTPPCYDASKSYPVLYMLHGMTSLDDQWVRIGLTDTANRLISSGQVAPLIIVLPQEDESLSDSNTSRYGDALIQEVIPWVDVHFAACTERACRAIGGLSRGGNWAIRLGFTYWNSFIAIGAHSAPLFYNDLGRIAYWQRQMPSPSDVPAIYMDMGADDENTASIRAFDAELTRLKIPHEFLVFDGYHDEAYWSAHVEEYLRWYAGVLSPAK